MSGAIDHDFDDAEQSAREQIEASLADVQTEPMAGGIAFDLVTRQPLFVRGVVADSVVEYVEDGGRDLASYKTHPYLPVTLDDPVYECVFIPGSPEGLTSINKTYDFPRGRLAHVPVEAAWQEDDDE